MTCPHGHSDAAYVLGALSPAERTAYESHLGSCPSCAAAVAHLAPLPGLLRRVDPAVLRRPEPEPAPEVAAAPGAGRLAGLLQRVSEQRRRRARRRRWQFAAAVLGAVLLAVAGTAAWLGPARDRPEPAPAAAEPMRAVAADAPVTAEVALTETDAGTAVWMRCGYPETTYQGPPGVFRLVAVGADGTREQVGSWLAGPGDDVTMTGVTRYVGDELARLELRGYDDAYLLSYEPG